MSSIDNSFFLSQAPMKRFLQSLSNDRLKHAYLVLGPEGSGKSTFVQTAAAAINCTGMQRPCGNCPACIQTYSGSFADLHWYTPSKKIIPVDDMRALINELANRPNSAQYKICVIEHADLMNDSSQNCLLKTLEEPLGNTVFFLLAESGDGLLPTIRSRCTPIEMSAVGDAELTAYLTKKYPHADKTDIYNAVTIADGVPGVAEKLLTDEAYKKLYRDAEQFLILASGPDTDGRSTKLTEAFSFIDEHKSTAQELLEMCQLHLRTKLIDSLNSDTCRTGYIVNAMDKISEAINALNRNANFSLTADHLLITINRYASANSD